MAGDWIKLQVATPHKPEVLTMAEMLGVPRREMIGILVDFLCWLDTNARHANVTHVSRKSLDDVLVCHGLASCLEVVGWVVWDDEARTMTIVNYERHNGESSKNRALATERKRAQRSREHRDESVTREEKKRSNTPIVPDGFAEFWLAYPKKEAKQNAAKAWRKESPDASLQARILADLRSMHCGAWTDRQFIPNPATYLNGRRWEDEMAAASPKPKKVAM